MPRSTRPVAEWLDWLTRVEHRRLLLGGLLLAAVVGAFTWIRRPGDFAGYLAVGNLVLEGRHIYAEAPPHVNTWPPFFSLLCVPLALLAAPTPYLARGIWLGLNAACLLLVIHLVARLVYGRALGLRADAPGLSLVAPELLVPLLLTGRYVISNFEHLQINLVLFAVTLGGLYLTAARRPVAGGVLLGFATAIKVMPGAFLLYLAYRRRWRAALAGALATAACSVSPILVFGGSRFWDYVAAWRAAVAAGWGAGRMNQSVFAMWDRFLGQHMLPFSVRGADELPESGEPLVLVAVALSLAVVTVLVLRVFRAPSGRDGWGAVAEWSIVFIVAALFGPVSWKAYLVVLLLPNALLFAVWRSPRVAARTRRVAGGVLLVAFVIGGLTAHGLVGRAVAETLEMTSVVTMAALVLLGGLLWLRPRLAT